MVLEEVSRLPGDVSLVYENAPGVHKIFVMASEEVVSS